MNSLGWVSLHRQITEHWLWENTPFAYGQAWIDMLLMANHTGKKMPLGNDIITLNTGEFVTSELKLMSRWGWSKTKVRNFLKRLESDGMIVKNTDRRKTTITIVNYSKFQNIETENRPIKNRTETDSRPIRDQTETDSRPIKDTNNNVNNYNNVNNSNNDNNVNNINYQLIADMYNDTCVSFPKLTKLSEKRKNAIRARLRTYTVDDFKKLFEMAESSSFLKGQNNRNWSATFDWLIADGNMAKVLDGNYANSKNRAGDTKEQEHKAFIEAALARHRLDVELPHVDGPF